MKSKAYSFSDPVFVGLRRTAASGPAGPDPADPLLWGWWDANTSVTDQGVNAGVASRIGDLSNNTADKTATTNTRNWTAMGLTADGGGPLISGTTRKGNMLFWSVIAAGNWSVSNASIPANNQITFSAQNGYASNGCWSTIDGVTYKFIFTARAISGNTNIEVYHNGSATGTATPLTITSSPVEYTVPFLGYHNTAGGTTSASIAVGFRDPNAAGFGTIEVTNCRVIEDGWDTDYVAATGTQKLACLANGNRYLNFWGANWRGVRTTNAGDTAQPFTLYMVMRVRMTSNGVIWMCYKSTFDWYIQAVLTGSNIRNYGNGVEWTANGILPSPNNWVVLVSQFNGASSRLEINGNSSTGTVGTTPFTIVYLNGFNECLCMDWGEVFIRTAADDAATILRYKNYLKAKWGISY